MIKKTTVIDLGYYYAKDISDYRELIKRYASASGHHDALAEYADLHIIRHLNQEVKTTINATNYSFFKRNGSRFWIPFRLHRYIHSIMPDVILLHGFSDPLKILLLSFQTKAKLVIQYHGGPIPSGFSAFCHRLIKNKVQHYIFTSAEQADAFTKKGIIHPKSKIHVIMEGSTNKKRIEKIIARGLLDIEPAQKNFLWVGRLDKNKDPLTVLKGFETIAKRYPEAHLYMIYSEEDLLHDVRSIIQHSEALSQNVKLLGKIPHQNLDTYYCSADYFVLGSHYEGSGFALCEALACGCIPLVTDIPSFRMMTDNGRLGSLWTCGDVDSFVSAVEHTLKKNIEHESASAVAFFAKELSFSAIAQKQWAMINYMSVQK